MSEKEMKELMEHPDNFFWNSLYEVGKLGPDGLPKFQTDEVHAAIERAKKKYTHQKKTVSGYEFLKRQSKTDEFATFGAGNFWGTEQYFTTRFKKLKGLLGYAVGFMSPNPKALANPTYE